MYEPVKSILPPCIANYLSRDPSASEYLWAAARSIAWVDVARDHAERLNLEATSVGRDAVGQLVEYHALCRNKCSLLSSRGPRELAE